MKKIIAIVLSLVAILGIPILLLVTIPNDEPMVSLLAPTSTGDLIEDTVNCVMSQRIRLQELFDGNFVVPFGRDGEPINVPNVNFIVFPEGDREYFLIGVEDIPTQECIDFILAYTGIPRELADIGKAYFRYE